MSWKRILSRKTKELQQQLADQNALIEQYKVMSEGPQYDQGSGLMRVGGGINRYGQARPGTLLLRDQTGNLDPRFVESMGQSFETLRDKAMTQGDTQSAALARQRQDVMRQADVDRMRRMQATGVTQGMRNLAMRGGVATGSKERLMRDATRAGMQGMQGIGRENRLANLGISMQDEAMKNQLLGKTGLAEQTIQRGNIDRLAGDIQNQNLAAQKFYEEDMRAFGAQKTAEAQRRSSGCFLGSTEIMMRDGSKKAIKDIMLGEQLNEGGMVTGLMKFLADDLYDYLGTKVTGGHAVKENGEWIRVKDSDYSIPIEGNNVVFNLNCENHIMLINNTVFADYDETDLGSSISDDESLGMLNGK